MLYIANVGEDEIGDDENDKVKTIREYAAKEDSEVIVISAKIEEEIATLDDEDKEMFLEDLGIEEPGLDRLIRTTYDLLDYLLTLQQVFKKYVLGHLDKG